jgi:hypothetical protein
VRTVEVHTYSGSVYIVKQTEEGNFLLQADNVPSRTSAQLNPEEEWPIQKPEPWPPQLGQPVTLLSRYFHDKTHPDRMPGGGKITSPVRAVIHREG